MRYRVTFAVGLAVGYVLGSRAGRERYEQIKRATQRVVDSPAVQEAAGLFGARVSQAAGAAKDKAGGVLSDHVPFLGRDGHRDDHTGGHDGGTDAWGPENTTSGRRGGGTSRNQIP
ncbi:YtxH domain-containing protein [Spongiactinospora sp. TRM90649]|uniref:YtxH domain-containing protein n=1 Tax=Spongiactinospora sp. TRM90649 TaxID=3031114 RepID=UPI0023F836BB|nr:YtxH domain-containing protein [Spongiactinospora sp. TRM90649]MDF5757005.1 YtxH domain-containing protein [Spongiactinospora sp. TRM90649]